MGWFSKLLPGRNQNRPTATESYKDIDPSQLNRGAERKSKYPKFLGSATDQLRGVRGGQDVMARLKLRDAFTPAQPVSNSRRLAGRKEVLQSLIRSLEDQRLHVVLYGERGIGKTSLLRVLSELAEEAQYVVRHTSCGESTGFDALMRAVMSTIPLLYHAEYDPSDREIEQGRSLSDLLPPTPVTANQVSDIFGPIAGTRLLLIIDEFDRSPTGDFRRSIAELIKNLSDRSVRVQLVIAGVASNLSELVEHIPSIRRNVLGLHVPVMDEEEVRELLQLGEESSNLRFDEGAIRLIVTSSCGSPYLASLLGQFSGLNAIDDQRRVVDSDDVAKAIKVAVDEIEQRVSEGSIEKIRQCLAGTQGGALSQLARIAMLKGGRIDTKASMDNDVAASECERAIAALGTASSLVRKLPGAVDGRYEFVEEGLPTYIWMRVTRDRIANEISPDPGSITA